MPSRDELAGMLRATRPDLIDGFACKAAVKALAADAPRAQRLELLNQELEQQNVEVVLVQKSDLAGGYSQAGLAGALTQVDGQIEVQVTAAFFRDETPVLFRALRFQSLVAHELVHRKQFKVKEAYAETRTDETMGDPTYLNDKLELYAMSAEVAHDLRTQAYLGHGEFNEISPRLTDLIENARYLTPLSIERLQSSLKYYY